MKTIREVKWLRFILASLVVSGWFATAAHAQRTYAGRFTLPCQVRWGDVVLPAGEYSFRADDHRGETLLHIQGRQGRKKMAFTVVSIPEHSTNGESALLISTSGEERVVQSLRLADPGVTFVYDRALAPRLQIVPILKIDSPSNWMPWAPRQLGVGNRN